MLVELCCKEFAVCNGLRFELSVAYADIGRHEAQLSTPAPVQSLGGKRMDQVYPLFFCISVCQQKTRGSNQQRKVLERRSVSQS